MTAILWYATSVVEHVNGVLYLCEVSCSSVVFVIIVCRAIIFGKAVLCQLCFGVLLLVAQYHIGRFRASQFVLFYFYSILFVFPSRLAVLIIG